MTKKAAYILEKQAISINPKFIKERMISGVVAAAKKYPKTTDRVLRLARHYTRRMTETATMPPGSSELVFATDIMRGIGKKLAPGAKALVKKLKPMGKKLIGPIDRMGDATYEKARKYNLVK